jgi:hypothetical protein
VQSRFFVAAANGFLQRADTFVEVEPAGRESRGEGEGTHAPLSRGGWRTGERGGGLVELCLAGGALLLERVVLIADGVRKLPASHQAARESPDISFAQVRSCIFETSELAESGHCPINGPD